LGARYGWEDTIRFYINSKDVGWNHLAQDRVKWQVLVNTVTNLWVSKKSRKFLSSWAIISI
jgi:hypothetical protein